MSITPWPMRIGSLVLREAEQADLDALLALRTDPVVNRFMVHTESDPEDLRREWLALRHSTTEHHCLVEQDGEIVAIGFLDVLDGTGQPGMPQRTEGLIGYMVAPRMWGRGIASGLAVGLLTAAFETLGLRRVTATCNADNPASARVLEKAGMRREHHGIEDLWHAELGWVDGYTYAMLAREWRARVE